MKKEKEAKDFDKLFRMWVLTEMNEVTIIHLSLGLIQLRIYSNTVIWKRYQLLKLLLWVLQNL